MADFTALKTAIQNAVKLNGNEEITGNILQDVLLAIVSTLGDGSINDLITALGSEATTRGNADTTLQQNIDAEAQARQLADSTLQGGINTAMQAINAINNAITNGCVYAGIATPSSTPASGKVFYLALTAGTYTNYGGLEVPQGINILKNNGSTWSLDSFVGIDDTPTPNSNKLVKSGGVLLQKLESAKSLVGEYVSGYYISSADGSPIVSANAGYIKYVLKKRIKVLRLKGSNALGNSSATIAFYKDTTVDRSNKIALYVFSGSTDELIDVPLGTVMICVAAWHKAGEALEITDVIFNAETDLDNIFSYEEVIRKYISVTGNLINSNSGAIKKYRISNITSLRLKGIAIGGSTSSIAFYSSYDSISASNCLDKHTYEGSVDEIINVPNGTKCIALGEWAKLERLFICDPVFESRQIELHSCICKPFSFENKKVLFFGDSITAGVASDGGLHTITECWAEQFSEIAQLRYTTSVEPSNQAISGSLFSKNSNVSITTIKDKILSISWDADVIIIAGGCNDYNCRATIGSLSSTDEYEVCGALNLICTYLQTQYPNATVIFITPINQTKGKTQPTYGTSDATQDEYRDAIFKVVTKYGYNVVDGSLIGFPKGDGDYADIMITDGIHPSELGHKFYAKSLAGILL